MTELSFLIDLLLEHKLPKTAKDAVRARIKEVEADVVVRSPRTPVPSMVSTTVTAIPAFANQAPSMQAIMARNPDLVVNGANTPEPSPVAIVAQTPAAAAAMASRAEAIAAARAGKPDASGGKRKF